MASSTSVPKRPLSDTGHQRLSSLTFRQRRMGPAPLASFEDLSMEKVDSSPEAIVVLPRIGEETSPLVHKEILNVPTSPTIRISAASSPSQNDSKESTPEREHLDGYNKSEYCDIEMTDLRSSTEELDPKDQERARVKREKVLMLAEIDKREEALKVRELLRKGSSSSVISDSLLPITSGHSSRLSSLGSIGSPVRRSPSPHKMLLETSFCGSKPIQHPSIDIEDPPISSMIHHAIEKLERSMSPCDAKPPDIFRSMSPLLEKIKPSYNAPKDLEIEASPKPSKTLESSKLKQELTKSLQRRHDQQRRQAEHHEYQQRLVDQGEATDRKMIVNLHIERRNSQEEDIEYRTHSSERQSRLEKRSPRLGKKVPIPQVPYLKELPRTSPSSPAVSALECRYSRSTKSTTPPGSPKSSKKTKRNKGHESDYPVASTLPTRKSSFSSFFKRSDNVVSPVTPDSPVSASSGPKSPFMHFIKNAENKLRSRSRSRSRSKSRDRDLEDDTHDRRKKLSLFISTKKKKEENENKELKESSQDLDNSMLNDPITDIEFKFSSEGTYQSSSFGLIRQESEISRAIKEPFRGDDQSNGQQPPIDRADSLTKLASLMSEANRTESITDNFSEEVAMSLREKEKDLMTESVRLRNEEEEVTEPINENTIERKYPSPDGPSNNLDVIHDQDPDSLSISESEKVSEVDYMKKNSKEPVRAESPDNEIKGLVSQESVEEGELPYVPTTLPQERSFVAPMIPVRERELKLKMTQSIERPRSTTPIQPSKLEEYKQSSLEMLDQELDKMTISIKVPTPGAVKVLPVKSPRRQDSKSWEDFCCEGLKSPRQLRRQLREKQQSSEDSNPPTPSTAKPIANDSVTSVASSGVKNWINFDEIPDIVLKPVRQIKTVPKRHQLPLAVTKKLKEVEVDNRDVSKKENKKSLITAEDSDKESLVHSSEESDDEKQASVSSSEDLNTVRETIEDLKKQSTEDSFEDLERLLAPVNDCITKLTSLASQNESQMSDSRKSPIPDNWEDFLLPPQQGRRSRISSIGSEAGSLSGLSLRSPSPSTLVFETSFCGSQPIDDPAFAEPDISIPLARKLSGISLGDLSPITNRGERGGSVHSAQYLCQPDRSSIMSDSSAESPKGSDYDMPESHRGQSTHLNPFGMDLEVKSNRSSIISQDQSPSESPYHSTRHTS